MLAMIGRTVLRLLDQESWNRYPLVVTLAVGVSESTEWSHGFEWLDPLGPGFRNCAGEAHLQRWLFTISGKSDHKLRFHEHFWCFFVTLV